MTLKELRKEKKLTQLACADYLGMPLRTYQNYENDPAKATTFQYECLLQKLSSFGFTDETHGILTLSQIKTVCAEVFADFPVSYCYLFGSYAKGKATEQSDVDLLVGTEVSGMRFYELVECLREGLRKNLDVLNQEQLRENPELLHEILKDGVKIYG